MSVYSFTDCVLTLRHPSLGVLTLTGQGLGSIAINMRNDRTAMDTAADGRVMTSKIKDRSATATLQLQQDSEANQTLLKWYNYLETAATIEWAQMTGTLSSPTTHEQIVMKEMAFQKLPDRNYAAQGQHNSYSLMIADCQQNVA